MIPKRIVLENFLSFGSPATEIEFADDEPLWVLGGPNGVGKSAVFDAMTYALYATHRGGAEDHTSLIRHREDGFRVVFEFEFNGIDYQITRNRPRKGGPTQSVKQWADGGWNKTVQLPPASGKQDRVKLWTVQSLGLGFDAFTASVLLRQGQADEIITATGSRRLAILKKIIGTERFEALSNRVHTKFRRFREDHERLCGERDALTRDKGTPPTPDELAAAADALAKAEEARTVAQAAVAATAERLTAAKTWAALDLKGRGLQRQIQEADARAAAAERIRAEKARLDDLAAVVPVLRQLVSLREGLVTGERTFGQRQAEVKRLADALRAKDLRDEIGRDAKCLAAADAMKNLRDELNQFDQNLSGWLAAAQERLVVATGTATAALEAKAAAAELLKKARGEQKKFAGVGVGIPCSLCGQTVTEEHAERERSRLAAEVRELEQKVREWGDKAEEASKEKQAVGDECDRLNTLVQKRDTTAKLLAEKQKTLRDLGVTAEPQELRRQIADKTADAERHEAAAGDQAGVDHATLETRLAEVTTKVRADEQAIAAMQGRQSTLRSQLSPVWSGLCENTDTKAADALDRERQQLAASGVAEHFKQLEEDAIRRGEWVKQLADINKHIDKIAVADRISEPEAEESLRLARDEAKRADAKRDETREAASRLARLAEDHANYKRQIRDSQRQADLHEKLDKLLGKGGLQRELVRTAEREIVRLANDTVQNLSDGDLTVELDDGADGDDEAFALRIRRADGPTPIGVHYLSGSQKFRVAISVALAIGRFAAGQARPLESVIIDEGFGSLDRDGLRAAADELNRLRQHLRRIVVVSHQEEFARRFPAVIQLSQGENGTIAAAVRQ